MIWPVWSQGSKDPCETCGVSGHRCSIDTQQQIDELEFAAWRYDPDDAIKRGKEEDRVFTELGDREVWGP